MTLQHQVERIAELNEKLLNASNAIPKEVRGVDSSNARANHYRAKQDISAAAPEMAKLIATLWERVQELEESLKIRTKQIGVACLKHDLTHSLACGRCFAEQQALIEVAREALSDAHAAMCGAHNIIKGPNMSVAIMKSATAITAVMQSKEVLELVQISNKAADYLDSLFPQNAWAGVASDELKTALSPFIDKRGRG